jgi:hypothetical protein
MDGNVIRMFSKRRPTGTLLICADAEQKCNGLRDTFDLDRFPSYASYNSAALSNVVDVRVRNALFATWLALIVFNRTNQFLPVILPEAQFAFALAVRPISTVTRMMIFFEQNFGTHHDATARRWARIVAEG